MNITIVGYNCEMENDDILNIVGNLKTQINNKIYGCCWHFKFDDDSFELTFENNYWYADIVKIIRVVKNAQNKFRELNDIATVFARIDF